ncbi:sugar transferase [Oceanobacillus piezotolerans]|uniref:Sugar transferase n=1 Tax=Oceanobacillus piezotolerans TaxID=2448030 RepID=A0A498D3H4_9BACI|nr:sugar transferase [Oceanobacillus piezotolerans]RLL42761.1 sugar transferase [Oceanobacillus piezotolerans]
MDFCISFCMIVILSPVYLIITVTIKWQMGSPVLFKQQRPGLNGRPFVLNKFRTMTDEVNRRGEILPDKKRLTPLGALLRKLSLDELPQFLNVLKGDMSLVGPRPLLMEYLPLYTKEQFTRHHVKPGITGWAQVNGRNAISWEEKFEHDIWYVQNQSLLLDCKILLLTIVKVMKREGISAQDEVTAIKFQGSKEVM